MIKWNRCPQRFLRQSYQGRFVVLCRKIKLSAQGSSTWDKMPLCRCAINPMHSVEWVTLDVVDVRIIYLRIYLTIPPNAWRAECLEKQTVAVKTTWLTDWWPLELFKLGTWAQSYIPILKWIGDAHTKLLAD